MEKNTQKHSAQYPHLRKQTIIINKCLVSHDNYIDNNNNEYIKIQFKSHIH